MSDSWTSRSRPLVRTIGQFPDDIPGRKPPDATDLERRQHDSPVRGKGQLGGPRWANCSLRNLPWLSPLCHFPVVPIALRHSTAALTPANTARTVLEASTSNSYSRYHASLNTPMKSLSSGPPGRLASPYHPRIGKRHGPPYQWTPELALRWRKVIRRRPRGPIIPHTSTAPHYDGPQECHLPRGCSGQGARPGSSDEV